MEKLETLKTVKKEIAQLWEQETPGATKKKLADLLTSLNWLIIEEENKQIISSLVPSVKEEKDPKKLHF